MSNNDRTETGAADQAIALESQWPFPKDRDFLLARLVELANLYGVEQGITLNVGGALISGVLISGATFLKEQANLIRNGRRATDNNSEELLDAVAKLFEAYDFLYQTPEGAPEDYRAPPPMYIHLRNARWFTAGAGSMTSTLLWRGRLTSVDGFAFGEMRP